MSTQLEWLEAQALALTPGERAAFATWLLASLEEDDGVGQAWAAEVDRRITLLESGAAQGLPAQQAIAQVRAE
ncbi:MAG: addiction module protein, partial [Rhodoferax sp.]|nr:addiction module protein [Rhodoferax sp.]